MTEPALFVCTGARDNDVTCYLNRVFSEGVRRLASDVHFEDHETGMRVRYRINGIMEIVDDVEPELARAIGRKVRSRAKMPLSERDVPLDGRINLVIDDHHVDIRVSLIPTSHGESIVCRLLDQRNTGLAFEDIQMSDAVRTRMLASLRYANGMILSSGPTGSGKTTTMYSLLTLLNVPERKIVTIEDPVEYRLPFACQIPVSVGTSFAGALRAVLRQDPDVILVGEIRDAETARIAIQAAMTGHLVLSTIHANDAATTVTRVLDLMGDENHHADPYLLEITLRAVVAQRLVRRLCPSCREAHPATRDDLLWLARAGGYVEGRPIDLYSARGCDRCHGSGYLGRLPIIEYLDNTPAVQAVIGQRERGAILRQAMRQPQYQPLMMGGIAAALQGETTLDEVKRVIHDVQEEEAEIETITVAPMDTGDADGAGVIGPSRSRYGTGGFSASSHDANGTSHGEASH